MRRRGSRKRRGGGGAVWVFTAALCVAGLLIGLLATYLLRNDRDSLTGCSVDSGRIQNTFSILIDASDSVGEIQRLKITNFVESLFSSTTKEDRFRIFLLDGREGIVIEPAFDRCNYSGDFSEAPVLTRYRDQRFSKELRDALELGGTTNKSPVISGINSVAAQMPRDHSVKHLVVISDMYENSSIFSMYNTSMFEAFDEKPQKMTANMPNLGGIKVYMKVIDRPSLTQGSEFLDGWLMFLNKAGAELRDSRVGTPENPILINIAERITG